jgi:hypothetical protein
LEFFSRAVAAADPVFTILGRNLPPEHGGAAQACQRSPCVALRNGTGKCEVIRHRTIGLDCGHMP